MHGIICDGGASKFFCFSGVVAVKLGRPKDYCLMQNAALSGGRTIQEWPDRGVGKATSKHFAQREKNKKETESGIARLEAQVEIWRRYEPVVWAKQETGRVESAWPRDNNNIFLFSFSEA